MSNLKINPIFSDHMVLQREKPIVVWGTSDGQTIIEVELNGNHVQAEIEEEKWTAILPPMETERNLTLTVRAGDERITISDVAVGEVWIGGGQSNMEFFMKYEAGYEEEIKDCRNEDIRFFDVPELCYPGHEKDVDFSRMGYWRTCDTDNLEYYSAVGYYFAKKLQKDLEIPIGIIGCNRGESPIVSWLPEEYAETDGKIWKQKFEESLQGQCIEEALETYRYSKDADRGNQFASEMDNKLCYGISHEEQIKLMEEIAGLSVENQVASFHTKPGCLYENMLLPLVSFSVRGVIWYHGETDSQYPEYYKKLWSEMIDCWRALWKEELPFICVQLAPFEEWLWCSGDKFSEIRRIQQEVSEEKNGVYLVSASDSGMRYDIHPKNKRPIGNRLALCAEKNIYGKNVSAEAPVIAECYRDGEDICVRFSCDVDELKLNGNHVEALTAERKLDDGIQKIDLSEIGCETEGLILRLKGISVRFPEKIRLSFAMTDYYEVNLYSSEGIPAMPFEYEV